MDDMEKADDYYEQLQRTQVPKKTSGVSKSVWTVKQKKCLMLSCVMTGVFLSLASLCVIILEKVEEVDGSWSGWAHWEACSTTCDAGMQIRQRICSNPAPSGNGRQCLGSYNEKRLCFSGPCSKQSPPTMESTAMLPCCEPTTYQISTMASYELDYELDYGSDDFVNKDLSRTECRPCGNVDDIDDYVGNFDHSGDYDSE